MITGGAKLGDVAIPVSDTEPNLKRVDRCVGALNDDFYRQGNNLSADDVDRATSRRKLSPLEVELVWRRLAELGIQLDERRVPQGYLAKTQPKKTAVRSEGLDIVGEYMDDIAQVNLLTPDEEVLLGRRIQAGLRARSDMETSGSTQALEQMVRVGMQARDHMWIANLRLVINIAVPYAYRSGMALLDVVQEGSIGLVRAVEKFNPSLGYKFSTYATWWIRQSITRSIADKGRMIRLPVHVYESQNKIRRQKVKLARELGRDPTVREIADQLDESPEHIQSLIDIPPDAISLDQEIGEGATFGSMLVCPSDNDPSLLVELKDRTRVINLAVSSLSAREGDVIRRHFGLLDGEKQTLEEIGRIYGVTRERIRQIEKKGLSKLNHPCLSSRLKGLL